MTKLDFAVHLFTEARTLTTGTAHRVPIVSVLVLLILSRTPDDWITGTDICADLPTVSSSTIISSTRAAVEAGLLEHRPYRGGVNGALAWHITPTGLRVVEKLMTAQEPATTPA